MRFKFSIPVFPGILWVFGLLFSFSAYSQSVGLSNIMSSLDTLRNRMPIEKVYLQFDKPYYTTGDTLWFKAYLFDAAYLSGSEKSGVLYLELANDTGKVMLRNMVLIDYGLGRGNIFLNKENIPEGSYTLRAYSNLMRNFGEDYIFKKSFYVSSTTDQNWLVSSDLRLNKIAGKDSVRLALQFSKLNKEAVSFRELQIRVMDGKRVIARDRVQTDVDGELDVNFILPEKADGGNISIIAEDLNSSNNNKMVIPVSINRPENIDLQFMPEGGSLVAGIPARVGLKAIGEDGKGTEISGKVYSSSSSQEVAGFNSLHKGMGSFEFIPKAGESYTAQIILADGTTKSYALPQTKSSGSVLRITNSMESDSLEITISVTAPATPATFYLIAQSRGIVCYGAMIRFTNGIVNTRKIAKDLFPTGVARFTLLSADNQPLNERVVFIDHEDNLNISINTDKEAYSTRDSVALNILVTDKDNKPVQGSFSLTVTDDGQVKTDSLGSTILTNLLLTSHLKGTIEDPGYYFQIVNERWEDLDNLLLTQGWVGYDWKDVFNPPVPEYKAQPEFAVKGRVSNVLNKDIEGSKVRLISNKPLILIDTLTDKEGLFDFKNLPLLDSMAFLLKATNKRGQSFNLGVEVEEFKPPVFRAVTERFIPWYLNSDSTLLKFISNTITQKKEERKIIGKNVLEEVTITAKKVVRYSHNLNGPGEADQTLDEKDMEKAGKTTLLELIRQRIRGFNEGLFPSSELAQRSAQVGMERTLPPIFVQKFSYKIFEKEIHLIIDGIDVEQFIYPTHGLDEKQQNLYMSTRNADRLWGRYEAIKEYLDLFTSEDILGIEVMYNMSYNMSYRSGFNLDQFLSLGLNADFVYLEITTRKGTGPFQKHIPGVYFYKPLHFAGSKTFYRPKYPLINDLIIPDLRSTIHWAPDVITDAEGKATVSFYSADRTGTYTVITEGSDMNGNIGSGRSKIKIIPGVNK